MDRFEELVVFTAILDSGSLAGAARRLRRSSPAVTRSLAALERRVGLRLIQRTTRRLTPTEAGQRLASSARRLLANYDEVVGTIKENRDAPLQGLLRLTAPSLFGRRHVMPLIASFLDTHRGIRIELVLTNTYLHLIEEGFDVAVRLGPLSDSGLVARRVGQAREVLLASPNYLAQRGRLRTPRDLAKHDVVFNSIRPTPLAWRFRVSGRDRTVSLTPKIIVSDTEAMLLAVRAGLGIGRALSYQAADDLSSGSLVRLLREFELPARPIYLVVPAARDMPLRVRAFLDHAVRTLGAVRVLHD